MEIAVLIVAGLAGAFMLAKLWQAGAGPGTPQVTARVVEQEGAPSLDLDEVALIGQLSHLAEKKAKALAYRRESERIIEAQAKEVKLPWASPSTPPEPPKA